ncbi:MAG TPA: PASTA domain-containing protein, partial [Chloroflexia bacterium]|nr:PASTA domain-containing protein [Chloroflexia bacterium]
PVLAVALVAGLLLLGLVAMLWPKGGTIAGEAAAGATATASQAPANSQVVPVPDLQGKSLDEATSAAQTAGLSLTTGDGVNSGDVAKGSVASQEPAPGSQVQKGSAVLVYLSLGPVEAAVQEAAPTPVQVQPEAKPPAPQPQPSKKEPPGKKKEEKRGKDK